MKYKSDTKETKQLYVQLTVEIPKESMNMYLKFSDWEKITGLKVKQLVVADVPK